MLEDISLKSLQRTKINVEFEKGIAEIVKSLEQNSDIETKREISLTIVFSPSGGYITTEMKVGVRTPKRMVKSIAALEGKSIKIDTVSDDVRQPDLYDSVSNVVSIKEKRS